MKTPRPSNYTDNIIHGCTDSNTIEGIIKSIVPIMREFKKTKHEVRIKVTGEQLKELGVLTARWEKEDES